MKAAPKRALAASSHTRDATQRPSPPLLLLAHAKTNAPAPPRPRSNPTQPSNKQRVRAHLLPGHQAANPLLPILVREAPGAEARLVARFAKGAERSVSVQGAASAADVERALQELAASG